MGSVYRFKESKVEDEWHIGHLREFPVDLYQRPKRKPLKKVPRNSSEKILINEFGKRIQLPGKDEIVIGRKDSEHQIYPDIDTTPIGGGENGVSNRHALITKSSKGYEIRDLDSAEGTYVNRKKLFGKTVCELRVGDEIRLGRSSFIFAEI